MSITQWPGMFIAKQSCGLLLPSLRSKPLRSLKLMVVIGSDAVNLSADSVSVSRRLLLSESRLPKPPKKPPPPPLPKSSMLTVSPLKVSPCGLPSK